MLSSPLLPLFLIILLNTLILIDSSAKANKKYQNSKLLKESVAFWKQIPSSVVFSFFLISFSHCKKSPWCIQSKQ